MKATPSDPQEGRQTLVFGTAAVRAIVTTLCVVASLATAARAEATERAERTATRSSSSRQATGHQQRRAYAAALYVSLSVANPLVTRTMTPLIRRPGRRRAAPAPRRSPGSENRPSFRDAVLSIPMVAWVKKGVPLDGTIPVDGLRMVPWLRTPGIKLKGHF